MKSNFFTLDWKDLGKSAITAAITALLTALMQSLNSGNLPTVEELKASLVMAAIAGISYLVKNLLTNSTDTFGKAELKSTTPPPMPTPTTQPSDRPPVPPIKP